MSRRLLKWLVLPLFIIVLFGWGLKSWLLHTDAGARWLIGVVSGQMGDQLSLGEISGNLDTGLVLNELVYRQDGLNVNVAKVEASGKISLIPLKVSISSLHAFDVVIHSFPTEKPAAEQESTLEDVLAGLKLPLELDMDNVQITRLKLIDESNEVLFQLDKSALSARWKDRIELRMLEVSNDDFEAKLNGDVLLEPPYTHQLQLSGVFAGIGADTNNVLNTISFEAGLNGTDKSSAIQLSNHSPMIEISGQIKRPLDQAEFDLHVQLDEHLLSAGDQNKDVLISDVVGKLRGLPTNYNVQLQASVAAVDYPPLSLQLIGQGGLSFLNVEQASVQADFLDANATGRVGWGERVSYDAEIILERLLPSVWLPEWPDKQFISGRVSANSEDSSVRIRQLTATIAGTDTLVEGQGTFDLNEGVLDGTLDWASVGWPLWQQPYQIESQNGQLQLSGAPDNWQFVGDIDLQTPEYPGGSFSLRGSGGLDAANLNIEKGEALGGGLTGNASFDWSNELFWQADLVARDLDTTAVLRDWPAQLDAIVKVSQNAANQSFVLQFDSLHAELGGQFEGQSLDGNGGLTYGDAGISFDDLQLHSENSRLTLQGNPEATDGVEFGVEIHGPDWISSFLGGEISGKGRIALAAEQPVIEIDLQANQLQWGDTRVEQISIGQADVSRTSGINLAVDVSELQTGDTLVQTARLVLTGDRDQQALSLDISQGSYQLGTNLLGSISSWTSLTGLNWNGTLAGTSLTLDDKPLLTQEAASPVAFSRQKLNLDKTCLTTAETGGLCVSSDWQSTGDFQVAVNLSAVPLSISSLVIDHGIEFTQTLGGEFTWQKISGSSPSGRLAVKISAGEFGDVQDKFDRVKTGEGFMGFELSEGNLTAGELNVPFPGVGQIDFNYVVSGLVLDGTGKVGGDVKVDLNDISVLEGLIPGLENFGGQLNADMTLSGLTVEPHLDGSIALLNASADIPFVGTQLREVSLQGRISNTDSALLDGSFKAGEGTGQIKLTTDYEDWGSPVVKLQVSGQALRVLNTPELRMDADTDISLGWENQQWTVGGSVLVQDARITPVTVVLGKVNESEDVTVVQGELPYTEEDEPQEPIELNGNLKVSLGDKVRVETDLAKAKLTGGVDLFWQDNLIPIADGAIQVSGSVSVFGPRLTLNDGQIRFPNIPADNPVLDVRAERDIFGNTQIRTAGVAISGTAKRPVIDAFTIPLTNSDRAWALLITGNDVDYGQSVGAFEVGTYIAPKLYLSYGISLFNDGNVVSARYDLKKGFGIKASSGQREAGIDVSYTVDR